MAERENKGEKIAPISIQQFLKGANYPASKQELIECARSNDAPDGIMDMLERMPQDRFGGPQDVQKGYSEVS